MFGPAIRLAEELAVRRKLYIRDRLRHKRERERVHRGRLPFFRDRHCELVGRVGCRWQLIGRHLQPGLGFRVYGLGV